MADKSSGGRGGVVGTLVFIILVVILFISNPNDEAVRTQLGRDGWLPIKVDRTNLGILSISSVTGITGATGTYIGVAGQIFKL